MTLRTSLVIGGDAQGAVAAANAAETGLNGITTAAGRAAAANDQLASSSTRATAQARAGYLNLGRQVSDVQVQLQGGANIGQIIAQQGGQVADAVAMMDGRFSGLARFLAGPWGAAVIMGTSLLASLAQQMIMSGDESDKLGGKSMTLHDALQKVGLGSNEARQALRDYNAEQDRTRKNTEDMIKLNLADAEAMLKRAIATRELLSAELERNARAGPGSNAGAGFTGTAVTQTVLALNAQDKKIEELKQTTINLRIEDATRDSKAAADPVKQINNLYDDQAAAARRAAAGNEELSKSLKGTLSAIEAHRKADLDAERKSGRSPRPKADPYAGRDLADFGSPVPGARVTSGYGTRLAPTKGASTSHLALDYAAGEGTPVYATQDGVILHAAKRGGYGQQIGIGHGGGTETRYSHLSGYAVQDGQQVGKGQLIGYAGSTGTATGPHLHYEVLVNGKKVNPAGGKFPFDPGEVANNADKAADALEKFGEQASDKIARISGQWDEQPRLIDAANNSTRELNRTIEDLTAKNIGGIFDDQIAAAEAAKQTIQEGLLRPFEQLKEDSRQRLETERLITAGKEDEARALEIIHQFEERNYQLSVAQKQEILEQVRHEREVTEELQRRQALLGQFLDTTRSIKQEIVSIFAGNGSVANIAKMGQQLNSQMLVEKLFGPAFKDLDSWVKDQSGIKPSVEYLTTETTNAGNAVAGLVDAIDVATQRILNPPAAGAGGLESSFDQTFGRTGAKASGASLWASLPGQSDGAGFQELTVRADPNSVFGLTPQGYFDKLGHSVAGATVNALNDSFNTQFFSKFEGVIAGAISGYASAGNVGGVLGAARGFMFDFGKDVFGEKLSDGILGGLEKGLKGAETGTFVSGIAKSFGIKLSSGGAQLGGALGSFLPIPGGSIIGSIAGGILGNMFGTRPRGGATVSNTAVNAHANTGDITASLNDTGSNLQSTIAQIAGSLGASVGNYSIGVGRYKDYYQVSSSGSDARLGNSYFGRDSKSALYDGLDPAAAMKAALAGAISQGAIQGISAAMQKALASNKDVQAAIQEALKVHEVELAIGGIGAELAEQFKQFEKQAAERLRVAREYGFDVARIEAKNAEDRAKLLKDMLADQVGSLQQLIDDMTSGSLFEGSAVDQRQVLLGKISAAKAEADKGTEGAADTLAQLLAQLNAVSKEAYGTTGGFADDRTTILDAARDTITKANQRIEDAKKASDPALTKTNAALDENNDQNAQIIAGVGDITTRLDQLLASIAPASSNLLELARTSQVSGR
ncbi:MAG: peptidoglycan DD-metalloendopeptidase family protein [Novosphingobium sp.]|uniref:peptidoglycan DD-metalloendopeptidase family protein n=1 Tax=Novosphingobium sp. TaxID=1874826 RepID=UPI0032BDBF4E